jgi:Protein of unknown function (DUF3455)
MEIRKATLRKVYFSLSGLCVLAVAAMGIEAPAVPNNLKVPDGQMVLLKALGQGVQQRVDTEGGIAPRDGCDAQHSGAEARVDYKAAYYFYAQTPARGE